MNYYGSRLSYENSKELATLHERNGNYYEAERVLSEVLMFSADEFFYYDCEESVVNQLLRLYHRFLQRILTTKLEGFSKAAAQKTILNLVARIDDHRLTSALYWEPWVGLEVFHSNALFFAAKYDACNLARFALDRGVDIERTYRDRTALHFALEFQSSRVVKLLVAKGASIEVVDDWGETPLLKAVMSKSLDQVALLISRGASLEAQGSSCWTPLMQASLNGSLEIVRMLLENGAKVNATVKSGETALYLAAEKRHFGTLRLLLTFNADILVRGFSGKTVLHAAALRRDCNDSNAVDCVHALVDSGLDVDAYNDVGETPLHLASFQCSHRLVAYLLKKGASPLAKAYRGTALHFAVDNEMRYQKDSEMLLVVASLFAYGAIANESRPLDGKTPLHLAAQFTREYDDWYGLKVLQLLLRYGGDMDRLDSSQLSPIDYLRQANPDAVCLRVYLPEYESEISNSGISLPTA
ncbi:MAG: hypothetical protein L6R41_000063 [Letrouitia leprolyta]|nr:MAG: hypothetical protein L6R41_000063 [Letrouitia leprolyta]